MPSQQQVQNLILSASWVAASLTEKNRLIMNSGVGMPKWDRIARINRYLNAVQRQYNLGDLTSANFLSVYDCLYSQIGLDTTANTIDPNYHPNSSVIVVINPAGTIAPEPYIPFDWFDPASQLADGGRINLFMPAWKGYNPVLTLTSPAVTALNLGVDYVLIPSGGISLLITSQVLPEIYPGQSIRADSYVQA